MSEQNQTIEERVKALESETEALLVRLLALGADAAHGGYWAFLPALMAAARHVEAARQQLSDPRRGGRADETGQINPPPVDSGGGAPTWRA